MLSVEHRPKIIATPDGAGVAAKHQSKGFNAVSCARSDNIWPHCMAVPGEHGLRRHSQECSY